MSPLNEMSFCYSGLILSSESLPLTVSQTYNVKIVIVSLCLMFVAIPMADTCMYIHYIFGINTHFQILLLFLILLSLYLLRRRE